MKKPLDERKLFEFLKFHKGIVDHTQAPYLRSFTALDFCKDNLKMDYESAQAFLDQLFEDGYLEWDQYGAFPGSLLTAKTIKKLTELTEIFTFPQASDSTNSTNST